MTIKTWVDLADMDFMIPKGSLVECPFCGAQHKAYDLRSVNAVLRDGCSQCEPEEVLGHDESESAFVGINAQGHLEMFLKEQQRAAD